MSLYIDTRGRTKIAVAICGRCSIKMPYDDLREDPNSPGLWVCDDDLDVLDPWRLPARETENITLEHPRPDVNLSIGPTFIPINQPQAVLTAYGGVGLASGGSGGGGALAIAPPVTQIDASVPWSPSTPYQLGQTVTPGNPVGPAAAGTQIFQYLCIIPGASGATPPDFPTEEGVTVVDGRMMWVNMGLYLP